MFYLPGFAIEPRCPALRSFTNTARTDAAVEIRKSKLVSKILQVVGLERNRFLSIQGCLVVTGRMKYEGDLGQSRLFSRPYSLLTHKWSQDVRSNCMASYARKRLPSSIRMTTFGFRFTQFPYFNWGF